MLKSAGARYASLQKLVEAQQGDLRLLQASAYAGLLQPPAAPN